MKTFSSAEVSSSANYFADDETSDDEIYNNFLVFVVERENLTSESHILEHASKFDEI